MKKIRFIDCGANVGQSIDWFINNFEDLENDIKIDSFEANSELVDILKQKISYIDEDITIHESGVDTEASRKKFYLQDWGAKTGSSLIKGKSSTNSENFLEITTINLCDWINENCNFSEEHIILKLDIEGTEYKIVEALIEAKLNEKLTALLIEWTPVIKLEKSPDFKYTEIDRQNLIKLSKEKFKLALDWQSPNDCTDPLRSILENENI